MRQAERFRPYEVRWPRSPATAPPSPSVRAAPGDLEERARRRDSSVLTIEPRAPARSKCECCGSTTTTLTRFVYRDWDAHGIYFARFSDNNRTACVSLLVSIGDYGEGTSDKDRVSLGGMVAGRRGRGQAPAARRVVMELRPGDGVTVRDADESPWRDARVVGRVLNRSEELAHPLLQEAFHIVDHAVLEDEPLRAYLERAKTFRPN